MVMINKEQIINRTIVLITALVALLTIKSINMNKLIKPFKLKKSNLKHILFAGTKEYPIPKKHPRIEFMCSLRRKDNPRLNYAQLYGNTRTLYKCQSVQCKNCFYNAKNFLNVLKYRKKILNE